MSQIRGDQGHLIGGQSLPARPAHPLLALAPLTLPAPRQNAACGSAASEYRNSQRPGCGERQHAVSVPFSASDCLLFLSCPLHVTCAHSVLRENHMPAPLTRLLFCCTPLSLQQVYQ